MEEDIYLECEGCKKKFKWPVCCHRRMALNSKFHCDLCGKEIDLPSCCGNVKAVGI